MESSSASGRRAAQVPAAQDDREDRAVPWIPDNMADRDRELGGPGLEPDRERFRQADGETGQGESLPRGVDKGFTLLRRASWPGMTGYAGVSTCKKGRRTLIHTPA